jgi:hypothetical protein
MQFTVDTDLAIAGVALGLVAIVMAAPPLLQMLYGRPRLDFSFDEFTGPDDDGKQLLIAMKNKRTESRFLRKIGVERTVGTVLAYFDIQEQGTKRFVKKRRFGTSALRPDTGEWASRSRDSRLYARYFNRSHQRSCYMHHRSEIRRARTHRSRGLHRFCDNHLW